MWHWKDFALGRSPSLRLAYTLTMTLKVAPQLRRISDPRDMVRDSSPKTKAELAQPSYTHQDMLRK